MNFLNKPGIQNSIDNIVINNNNLDEKVDENSNVKNYENNKSYYLVISSFILFIIFFLYVIFSNSNTPLYTNSIVISDIIEDLNNKKNMIIKSVENNKNKIHIILSCATEGSLFENAYEVKNKYSNVKIKTNNNLHQIWIQDHFATKSSFNMDKILNLINNDSTLNLEKEIIDDNLIIIGTIKDIMYLFLLFEKNDLEMIEFKLNLIKYEFNKKFYKLII